MLAINRNPLQTVIGQKRAHPRLPWHSQCPLTGIGRGTECCAWLDAPRFAAKPQVQGRLASGEEFGPFCEYAPAAARFKPRRTQTHLTSKIWDVVIESKAAGRFGMACHSASLAGQAMNRYRGTQAEFQFSIVAPHTAHSKLLISRASAMCSLRS
jgi:hypothetical protein